MLEVPPLTKREVYEYYKKACYGGNALGCHNLGKMYYLGLYHKQDYNEAFSLFDKSCKGGSYRGCSSLGVMFYFGRGVDKDKDKAFVLYKEACENYIFSGCNNMASIYHDDEVVNYDLVIHNYEIACTRGIKIGCNNFYRASQELSELEGDNDSNMIGTILSFVFLRGLGRIGRVGRAAGVGARGARVLSARQIQKMNDIAFKRDRAWQNHLSGQPFDYPIKPY